MGTKDYDRLQPYLECEGLTEKVDFPKETFYYILGDLDNDNIMYTKNRYIFVYIYNRPLQSQILPLLFHDLCRAPASHRQPLPTQLPFTAGLESGHLEMCCDEILALHVGSDKPTDAKLEMGTHEDALMTAKDVSSKKASGRRFHGVSSMLCDAPVQTKLQSI